MGPDRAATGGTSSQSTAFLPLSQVLEEEFVALHGPLPGGPLGTTADPLPVLYEAIHALPEKRAALCLSGGGIRSATFALGVLQGLARAGLLTQFHYLSTVSGGGYIGSWLSAWIHRTGNDVSKVAGELASLKPRA
ncbi:MAG TPA: patatin-like phospholipase family protein, partial [Methylomirabilota bacterium]|nr:patatin-like phospholipase family protein [Methylomirabilota bacterium]